ncbi:MAG: TlpA family protein disulfide reductase [Bacteroidetes bacterium]|nr:TlpA family protein disulfide reductase [Bacteroidota bacterium]
MINKKLIGLFSILLSLLMIGCSGDKATIKGTLCDLKNETLLLEQLAGNQRLFVDSVKVSADGSFSVKYLFESKDEPVLLNLRHKEDYITLLVEAGEKVDVESIINLSRNYSVSGSKGSEQLKMLSKSLILTSNTIDSLYGSYNKSTSYVEKESIIKQIKQTYINHKRANIDFVLNNSNSIAAMVALYQRMPNGINVFGDKNDILYFRKVNEALLEKYPNSRYVQAMGRDIKEQENRSSLDNLIRKSVLNSDNHWLPEIDLNDIYGREHKLSDLKGKVVLLNFWSYTLPNYSVLNAEMRDVYEQAKDKGFEIYQVCLDDDKATWIGVVLSQSLPWISVLDPKGAGSIAAKNYNISTMPANFLIDRDGNIVGKNIWGADLVNKINEITE